MSSAACELSIIIPAYNEAARLGPTIARLQAYAGAQRASWELIVVDDGSTDATAALVRGLPPGPLPMRLLSHTPNRGKGFSLRAGMAATSGDLLLLTDADLSCPIEELEKLRPWLSQGYDVVIASRDVPGARLDPPQPAARRLLAALFRTLRRRVLLPALRDTQCGFKLLRRAVAADVLPLAQLDGWLFDCELLGLAVRRGFRVREVGVHWQNHPASRVQPLRVAWSALPILLSLRRRLRRVPPRPQGGAGPQPPSESILR